MRGDELEDNPVQIPMGNATKTLISSLIKCVASNARSSISDHDTYDVDYGIAQEGDLVLVIFHLKVKVCQLVTLI